MIRYFSLYQMFFTQRMKILLEHRLNFFIGAFSTMIIQASNIAALWVVMSKIPNLHGWTLDEILLVYSLITIASSLNHMFADNLWTLGRQYIRSGGFDRFLVRPIDPLFHLLADRFCHDGLGNFIVGVLLLVRSSIALQLHWSIENLFVLVVSILSGGVIFIALNLFTSVTSFWIMDSVPVTRLIFDNHLFARYPISIYPKAIRILLTWIIPYGLISFYPANYILGKELSPIVWFIPLAAAILFAGAYQFWNFGLKYYSSTGS